MISHFRVWRSAGSIWGECFDPEQKIFHSLHLSCFPLPATQWWKIIWGVWWVLQTDLCVRLWDGSSCVESYRYAKNNWQTHQLHVLETMSTACVTSAYPQAHSLETGAGAGLECWLPCPRKGGEYHIVLKAVRGGFVRKCLVTITSHRDSFSPPKHT